MFVRAGLLVLLLAASVALPAATAMSQGQLDPARLRKYLDDHYPFIDQSAEPLGRWAPSKLHPGQTWSGKSGWRTRHGDAVVRWDHGKPVHISNARFSDGTEIEAEATMGSPLPWRHRLPGEPRRWQHGTVEIRPDGVTFTPGELPNYEPPVAAGWSQSWGGFGPRRSASTSAGRRGLRGRAVRLFDERRVLERGR